MMNAIFRTAQAGSLESGDVLVTVAPAPPGSSTAIEIESIVLNQYGEAIRRTIAAVLAEEGVGPVCVKVNDRGALDFAIRARTLAALARAGAGRKEDMA